MRQQLAGGEPGVILVRTKQAILKEVALSLLKALDHGGLLCGGANQDYVIFLPSAIYDGPVLPSCQAKTAGSGYIGEADGERRQGLYAAREGLRRRLQQAGAFCHLVRGPKEPPRRIGSYGRGSSRRKRLVPG